MKQLVLRTLTALPFAFLIQAGLAQIAERPVEPWDFEEARQFDFWLGEWRVNNRFLRSGNWVDGGEAQVQIFLVLDGKAVLEFWDGKFRNGSVLRGYSLRYYDQQEGKWMLSLNWPGPNRPSFGALEGSFRHGRGEFFVSSKGQEGKESITRYTFSDISPTSLRWDDSVSTDGGKTWSANWIMEFSRTAEHAQWTGPDAPFHTYEAGERCTGEFHNQFSGLAGDWQGMVTQLEGDAWNSHPIRLWSRLVLDGCGVMSLSEQGEGGEFKEFQLRSFLPQRNQWVVLHLDNRQGTGYRYQSGVFAASTAELIDDGMSRKTIWTRIEESHLAYELSESEDEGESWKTVARVELTRKP